MTGGYVEKSFAPAPADLEAIGAFTRRAFAPEELYVFSVVLCNNDVDRDHEKFTRRALEELGALFVGKTGIFDHSMKSGDQAARIYATAVVPVPGRKTADGEDLVALQAKAYMVRTPGNAELITQIDGGIKKEVSVSCAMGSAVCSLCGADRRSGGCSHVPGSWTPWSRRPSWAKATSRSWLLRWYVCAPGCCLRWNWACLRAWPG